MRRKHLIYLTFSLLLLVLTATSSYAQEEEMEFHELKPEDDAFQDAFFAALRYKAIGNYKLALQALDKAERESGKQKEKQEVVSFERAQNHYYLKEYQESIIYLEELQKSNKQREVLVWLFKSYMEAREYKEAKIIVVQLLEYSEVYLPNFYMLYVELTNEPKEALKILERVSNTKTNTRQVGFYKELISETLQENKGESKKLASESSGKDMQKLQDYLQQKNWKEVEVYMELLLQEETNAASVWQQLEATEDVKQAYESLGNLFTKGNIPDKSKQSVLTALLERESDADLLQSFINQVYQDLDAKPLIYLGNYFLQVDNKKEAKRMYLKSLAISFDNYSLIVETLQLLSDTKDYDDQLKLANNAMDFYPMQPLLYLHKGEALVGMQRYLQAKEVLEEGASYVIDQPDLEKEFASIIQKADKHLN